MKQNKEKNFVSVVAYIHDDSAYILDFLQKITKTLAENFEKYEIIFVDDASEDDTAEIIRNSVSNEDCMVQIVHMSYFQGVELAMNAGVALAIGDFIFEFDSVAVDYDLSLIMQLYNKSLTGYDIVSAAPRKALAASSKVFYYLYNHFSQSTNALRTERFRILSRRAINRIHSMSKTVPYRKALYANCGLAQTEIFYDQVRTYVKKDDDSLQGYRLRMAVNSLIIFTEFGYKAALYLSLGMILLSIGLAGYTIMAFCSVHPVSGWTSMMLVLAVSFAGMFAVMAIIIKYLDVLIGLVFKKRDYTIKSVEKLTR